MKVVAVIMAGGKGERFWPLSRKHRPKQFLCLNGQKSMIQSTVDRVTQVVRPENVYVVTGPVYANAVLDELQGIPEQNVVVEPEGRDTAPCIALAAATIGGRFGFDYKNGSNDCVMLVLPSDHLIRDERRYIQTLRWAAGVANSTNALVTIGIKPTRPETGYGYIECGQRSLEVESLVKQSVEGLTLHLPVWVVKRFREKPDRLTASQFLESGNFLWNSGMFVWKISSLLDQFRRHMPELFDGIMKIMPVVDKDSGTDVIQEEFSKFPRISIDYGLMEKADKVYVIPGEFGWDDVGSWSALSRLFEPDEHGNVTECAQDNEVHHALLLESNGCIVYSMSRLVAAVGIRDIIIVETDDVVLVCHKSQEQRIKEVLSELKARGLGQYL